MLLTWLAYKSKLVLRSSAIRTPDNRASDSHLIGLAFVGELRFCLHETSNSCQCD